jgi:ankyrin repeat protein
MKLCLSPNENPFLLATATQLANPDQILAAVLRSVEILPFLTDTHARLLSGMASDIARECRFTLVTDLTRHLINPRRFDAWIQDVGVRTEFFRKVLGRDVIFKHLDAVEFPSLRFTQLLAEISHRLAYDSVPKADTLEGIIARDDIEKFRSLYHERSIDKMLDEGFHCFRECSNVLSLCAFLGAIRCFEYVLPDCHEVDDDLIRVSVRGGNVAIFQMLCGIGIDMTKCRSDSIRYHRADIFDVISSGRVTTADLFECLRWKNGDVIVRHIEQLAEIAIGRIDSLLLTAVESRFVAGLRWLLDVSGSELDSARLMRTAIAVKSDDCLVALIRSGKIDVTVPISQNGATVLHWAAKEGKVSLIKTLLKTAAFGVTTDGYSALDYAMCHGRDAAIQVLYSFPRRSTIPASLRTFPHLFVVRNNHIVAVVTADELPAMPSRIVGLLDLDEPLPE